MAIGWFIAPYKRRDKLGMPGRYCAMDDYSSLINSDGGKWAESEFLGDRALVRVRARAGTLTTIGNDPDIRRLPNLAMNDVLGNLTARQKTRMRNELTDAGYTLEDYNARHPFNDSTFRQYVRFLTGRRRKPRYNQATDSIICDGPEFPCKPIEDLENERG